MGAVVGAVLVVAVGAVLVSGPGAGAVGPVTGFYLDVGGSASLGWQPTTAHPDGERTDRGYANDVVALEAGSGVSLQLVETGCPGETTWAMLAGGDRCYRPPGSQLAADVAFLAGHRGEPGIVSVDLGHNDLFPCLASHRVDEGCVDQRVALVGQQLTQILGDLRAAAGPDVTFVGVGSYDPFLAGSSTGEADPDFARQSLVVVEQLDRTLAAVYGAAGVPVARVAGAFEMADTAPVTVQDRVVPVDVARVCALTWMCQPPPLGPNIHPNDDGYEAIARSIVAAVPSSW